MIIVLFFIIMSFGFRFIKDKYLILYAIVCALIIGFMSYHLIIPQTADMHRHLLEIDYVREYGWEWISSGERFSNIGTAFVFYLLSFFPDSQIFVGVVGFVGYFLIFRLLIRTYSDFYYPKKWLVLASLFVTLSFSYFNLILAVRMWLVFIVFFNILYDEAVLHRNRILCWFGYFLLILFHYASLILVLLRIGIMLVKFQNVTRADIVKRTLFLLLVAIIGIILWRSNYLSFVSDKINMYRSYATRGLLQTISCSLRVLGVVFLLLVSRKNFKNEPRQVFRNISIGVIVVILIQIQNYQVLLRFADCLIIAVIPLLSIEEKKGSRGFALSLTELSMIFIVLSGLIYNLIFDYRLLEFAF